MISARHDFMEFNVSFDVTVLIVVDIDGSLVLILDRLYTFLIDWSPVFKNC